MSTVVKTFAFLSENEGLADAGSSADITVSWVSADGSPAAGCLDFNFSGAMTSEQEYARNASTGETWEDWGVPGGATVTHVQVTAFQDSFSENNKVTACSMATRIIDSSGISVTDDTSADILQKDIGVDGWTWAAGSAGSQIAVNADRQASNTDVRLEIDCTQTAGGGNNANYRLDTIQITVTYTGGVTPIEKSFSDSNSANPLVAAAAILALSVGIGSSNAANWQDVVEATRPENAQVQIDNSGNWGDAVSADFMAPLEAQPADDNGENWSDGVGANELLGINPADTNSSNPADAVDKTLEEIGATPIEKAVADTNTDNWADATTKTLMGWVQHWQDAVTAELEELETTPKEAAVASDNSDNPDDAISAFRTIGAQVSDALSFADAVDKTLTGVSEIEANPASSNSGNWSDAIAARLPHNAAAGDQATFSDTIAALRTLLAQIADENGANPDDSVTRSLGLRASVADSNTAFSDAIAAKFTLAVNVSDTNGANWADSVSKTLTGEAALEANPADSNAGNWADGTTAKLTLAASVSDTADNWQDSISAIRSLALSLEDNADNWQDEAAANLALRVAFSDDANNWADAVEAEAEAGLTAQLADDNSGNWSDTTAARLTLSTTVSDTASQDDAVSGNLNQSTNPSDALTFSDAFTVNLTHEAQIGDDANNWSDVIDGEVFGPGDIRLSFTDSNAENWADFVAQGNLLSATPITRAIKASPDYAAVRALYRTSKLASYRRTASPDQ